MVPRFALAFSHQVSYQALRRRMPAQLEARRLRKTYGGRVLLDALAVWSRSEKSGIQACSASV